MVLSCQHLDKLDIIAEVLDNNINHIKLHEESTIYTQYTKRIHQPTPFSLLDVIYFRSSLFQPI